MDLPISKLFDLDSPLISLPGSSTHWIYDFFDGQLFSSRENTYTDIARENWEYSFEIGDVVGFDLTITAPANVVSLTLYKNGKQLPNNHFFSDSEAKMIVNGKIYPFVCLYKA